MINLETESGARFFLALAEAEPAKALLFLKGTVGTWDKKKLLQFTTGRREVVHALEMIVMWRELFADAARLLLNLGEAENENWGNNASGVFADLFSMGHGRVAPTEAPPQERFPILKEALESESKEKRTLALRACNKALESGHFCRTIGVEHQGLRKEPKLWTPKTWGEIFDGYRQVWQFLYSKLDYLRTDEQQEAIDIMLGHARGLGNMQNLADMVIDTVREISLKPYAKKKKVLEEIISILHYEGKKLPPQTRQRWEQLKDNLTGSDFSSLMKRYAGMDVFEDKFDEEGNQVDQIQARIEELAQQAIENKNLLQKELGWLVTTEAQSGYRFGYEIGKRDKDFVLLPILLKAQREAEQNISVYFIGGYFRALSEKNRNKLENQLDALVKEKKLNAWIPELTWRSGVSNRGALRILGLAQKGIIKIEHFGIFGLGGVIQKLSENVFKKWIGFLLGSPDYNALSISLDLYNHYYLRKKSKYALPKRLTFTLLTHPLLFQKPKMVRRHQMDEWHWSQIGKKFIKLYPEESLKLADMMLKHFGKDGSILDGFHSSPQEVLNEIIKLYAKETWDLVTKYIGPPIDSRAYHINRWLRGGQFYASKEKGTVPLIPLENIWDWVDKDVEKRAIYLANFVPKVLHAKEGEVCLAREVLIRYGNRKDVRNELMANFYSGSWSGPESMHCEGKKQQLLEHKKKETNENVKRWIDEFVVSLDHAINRAKIGEERRGF